MEDCVHMICSSARAVSDCVCGEMDCRELGAPTEARNPSNLSERPFSNKLHIVPNEITIARVERLFRRRFECPTVIPVKTVVDSWFDTNVKVIC